MMYLYDIVAGGFLLLASPYYAWRLLTSQKYRAGLRQRLGFYPQDIRDRLRDGNWIWVHAVSLGEVNAVRPLLAELENRFPDHGILVSTVTDTGQARARELPGVDATIYLPLDVGPFLRRLLAFLRPSILIIAETELWPRLVYSVDARGIPVCMVNGRISDRSYPRYQRARFLTAPTLRRMSIIGMQSEEDGRRVKDLGAPEEKVRVTGNLKFDSVKVEPVGPEECNRMRREWGLADADRLIVGGSTWPGEEEALVDAYVRLAPPFPGLRLLIAPRHLERLEEIEELIRRRNLSFATRTGKQHDAERKEIPPVLILDTIGELARTYALAEIAFVGKSLTATGGQNPLEPAGLGVPVCFGPHMENFRSIAPLLVEGGGARVVESIADVEPALRELLANPDLTREMGKKAREIVEKGSGAAIRTADALVPLVQAKR